MKNFGEKYYIGLDMGTNSVGWAVTDEHYLLRRAKGKDLWGARLFDEAQTSAERRGYRTSRRRLQRERARIGVLKELFADEIYKVDPAFYLRLEESKYHLEDRDESNQQKYALFTGSFTDKDYYQRYPTIFHLRKELIENEHAPYDVRLVFLALLNMFKHRGNFLNSSLEVSDEYSSMKDAWETLCAEMELYGLEYDNADYREVEKILGEKGVSRSVVFENLCNYLHLNKDEKAKREIVALLCGKTGKLANIYNTGENEILDEEQKGLSICFRDANDEKMFEAQEALGDQYYNLIAASKRVHDIGYLASIMHGKAYLTDAKVESYENHKNDLRILKKVIKSYAPEEYEAFFRVMDKDNYSAYVGTVNSHGVRVRRNGGNGKKTDTLYKRIKNILKSCPQDDADVQLIIKRIESEEFLPKQLTFANGVIPNQVYVSEMKTILGNAEKYLPFLKEKDENGLSVSERILKLFSFRIPYYVGPIGQEYADRAGYNVWSVRKEQGRVYPWNFEEKIDTRLSAEKFIDRMVRHCSYLNGERTLPKCSLKYERFMVLNELNKLKVYGEPISVEIKQDIYNTLFCKGKKVTIKQLENYFKASGAVSKDAVDFLSGIDMEGGVKGALSTYGKFASIFEEDIKKESVQKMIENIVFWMTVYGEDINFVKDRIQEEYGDLVNNGQLKRIMGFKFSGWGNLSAEFLDMPGTDSSDERSILMALWETNCNLMELLSEKYSYRKALEKRLGNKERLLSEWTPEDLDGLYLSSPVRRMIWQTLKIMKELIDVTGHDPDRIFVEMPRKDGEKGRRTVSRKKKLSELYGSLGKEWKDWQDAIDSREESSYRIKKLYLYYLQMGKCMYTGETIDLDRLLKDNTAYDIDHIYPQRYIKDDSLENNQVLVKKSENNKKQDTYPINPDIQHRQEIFWKMLVEKKFITKEKYHRLTRKTPFTEEEKAAFISRQLVETRQGTKAITEILKRAFPDTDIIFSKAGEVTAFRKKYDLIKVRCLNDMHHAKDAYLNIVVGNTYYVKFTDNPLRYIKEASRNSNNKLYKYHMNKIFEFDVIRGDEIAWIGTGTDVNDSDTGTDVFENKSSTLLTVKKVMDKNSVLVTKKTYLVRGGITGKDTVWSAEIAKKNPQAYLAVSSDPKLSDVTKYGGRTDIRTMCYCLAVYKINGKNVRSIEPLPVLLGDIDHVSDSQIKDYLERILSVENKGKRIDHLQILFKPIRLNSYIKVDGHYYYLRGRTGNSICLANGQSLMIGKEMEKYLHKIEKAHNLNDYNELDHSGNPIITTSKNVMLFDVLIDKLNGSFRNKKTSILEKLRNQRDCFMQVDIEKQVMTLLNVIEWMNLTFTVADLSGIGSDATAGKCRMNKKITDVREVVLINQSVTGLFEHRIDLLHL